MVVILLLVPIVSESELKEVSVAKSVLEVSTEGQHYIIKLAASLHFFAVHFFLGVISLGRVLISW